MSTQLSFVAKHRRTQFRVVGQHCSLLGREYISVTAIGEVSHRGIIMVWGGGETESGENIAHPRHTLSPSIRAPYSNPFNSLVSFRIIMRLVAPHNASFQQTILYILYKYWDLSNICSDIASAVAATNSYPYRTYACCTHSHPPICTYYKLYNWYICLYINP